MSEATTDILAHVRAEMRQGRFPCTAMLRLHNRATYRKKMWQPPAEDADAFFARRPKGPVCVLVSDEENVPTFSSCLGLRRAGKCPRGIRRFDKIAEVDIESLCDYESPLATSELD